MRRLRHHHTYDLGLRAIAQRDPAALLLLARRVASLDDLRLVGSACGESQRISRRGDVILRLEGPHGPLLLHIEFESAPKITLPRRLLEYHTLVGAQEGLPVRTVLVLLRAPPSGLGSPWRERYGAEVFLDFHFDLLRLYEVPAVELAQNPALAPFAPLGAQADEAVVRAAVRVIHAAEPALRADRLGVLHALGSLLLFGKIDSIIQSEEVRMSWAAKKWIAEGFEQGRDEGRVEGRVEVLQQGMVPLLHLLVEARWPQEASALHHAIDALPPEQLLTWIPRLKGAVDPAQLLRDLRAARP